MGAFSQVHKVGLFLVGSEDLLVCCLVHLFFSFGIFRLNHSIRSLLDRVGVRVPRVTSLGSQDARSKFFRTLARVLRNSSGKFPGKYLRRLAS